MRNGGTDALWKRGIEPPPPPRICAVEGEPELYDIPLSDESVDALLALPCDTTRRSNLPFLSAAVILRIRERGTGSPHFALGR